MSLDAGTRLGPYEILSVIGAGGMGEVYKARDNRLNRTVAVKVLPQHISKQPQARARFKREAATIATLNHPHICTLHDVGQDGADFLVMEFLEGETLARRVQRGAIPLDDVLTYAVEIADALEQAHAQGVVHRDLKPGNVMLTKHGTKLLDFGLARPVLQLEPASGMSSAATAEQPLTVAGSILGTVEYMSPEQLDGKELDFRSDIFSFAVMIYEAACGAHPFAGASMPSQMSNILTQPPQPLARTGVEAPTELERIILKCLRKDRDERYQSTRDLLVDLRHVRGESAAVGAAAEPLDSAALRRAKTWWWVHHLAAMFISTPFVVAMSWDAHGLISTDIRGPVFLFNAVALGMHWSVRFVLISQALGDPASLPSQARRMRPWIRLSGLPVVAGLLVSAFFVASTGVVLASILASLATGGVVQIFFLDPAVERAAFPDSIAS